MTKINEIYKCNSCSNVIKVIHSGAGELVCCGVPMTLLEEKSNNEGNEKHVPVVIVDGNSVKVKVGSVPHPMEEEHYISLIEVVVNDKVLASHSPNPGEKPEAEWCLDIKDNDRITAREYCTLHGLWKSK